MLSTVSTVMISCITILTDLIISAPRDKFYLQPSEIQQHPKTTSIMISLRTTKTTGHRPQSFCMSFTSQTNIYKESSLKAYTKTKQDFALAKNSYQVWL